MRCLDIVLPVKERGELRLRTVGQPDKSLQHLLAYLDLPLPSQPKRIEIAKDVVETSS